MVSARLQRAAPFLSAAAFIALALLLTPDFIANVRTQNGNVAAVWTMRAEDRAGFAQPGAGTVVLPLAVQGALFIAQRQGVTRYRIGDGFRNDVELYQRLVEGLYPALPDAAAPVALLLNDDGGAGCRVLDSIDLSGQAGRKLYVALVRCA